MPLIRFDLIEGRTDEEIGRILDATHREMIAAFGAPVRDRYHVVSEHTRDRLVAQDTGLGFDRSDRFVLIQVVTRQRSAAEKQDFCERVCRALQEECGIEPTDVMISFVENNAGDWSFGHGRMQYLTGELSTSRATPG